MATYGIDELRELKEKAVCYIEHGNHTQCHWLYRNKSEDYFKKIFNEYNGLMEMYEKDQSGDPRNPINGKLDGLFFMAKHEFGEPQLRSAFGPVRFLVPAQELLERTPNIYFADFYCMRGSCHYVTLVVTSSYSSADLFCRDRLLRLDANDKEDNPFLYLDDGNWWVSNADYSQIEVFYTENIQMFNSPPAVTDAAEESGNILDPSLMTIPGALMKTVPIIGKGSSTSGGLRKNSRCLKCNLPEPDIDFEALSLNTSL